MTPLYNTHPLLHIGDDFDAARLLVTQREVGKTNWSQVAKPGWAIVHAAKMPWHANFAGYLSGAAPPGPEQYVARRDRRLALNLVDSPSQLAELVVPILDAATTFINEQIDAGTSILVHCNAGISRSPATVLYWMHRTAPDQPYDEALEQLTNDYPLLDPYTGIMRLVKDNWLQSPSQTVT